jgi:N-carbamoyl-L-amino-acid hydrolase
MLKEQSYSIEDIRYVESAFDRFYDIGSIESGGVTRLGYSQEEDDMHSAFAELGTELGLEVSQDETGNTYLANTKKEKVYLIGSHLDSVVDGGRYDGVAGILAGLLIMRWAKRDELKIPLKIAAFRCEESSNFGVSTLGSSLAAGTRTDSDLPRYADRNGKSLNAVFEERGYRSALRRIPVPKEYLELHIEQGKVLQEYNQRIGIVTTIAGPRRFNLYLQGRAEHSGTTPMTMRKDALCAAAELILEIERIGLEESTRNSVATAAVVQNMPNAINVIPGEVRLQVDVRGIEAASLEDMERRIKQAGKSIGARRGIGFIKENISETRPVGLSQTMQDKLERVVRTLGISYRRMISGAGHDAMQFANLCDTALLFIPCRDGVSHNKNEYTDMESICEGALVFYTYLREEMSEKA